MYLNFKKTGRIMILGLITGLILTGLILVTGFAINSATNNWDKISFLFSLEDIGKKLLLQGLPGLEQYELKDEAGSQESIDLIQQAIDTLAKASMGDPKVFLNSQMSYLQLVGTERTEPLTREEIIFFERDYTSDELIPREVEEELGSALPALRTTGEPLVAIYNSHNGETYTPDDGTPRIDGINGGIVRVAEALADALEKNHGIATIRSGKIHDYPSYALSYANSLKTVEEIIKKHPSVEIVIDVHRDYQPTKEQTTAVIAGEKAAKIMFIVGNDARQVHPRWRQNLAFVTSLEKKMDELYPGLSRGVRQQDGRYNQHLHPRSILVEIGSAENSLEEAKRSGVMLAGVIARMLMEIQQGQVNF